ncbi:MAG: FHA domain-containing protein, partial [Chromatiales bacterium]|nr:FHA domain-containing protein [Chromatiales bacterium]
MPAHLELSLNGTVLGEFGLIRERVTIGRNADGDVHLDNVAVSGTHAVIITMMGDSYVEDLESTNGTYVNGNLVRKHALRNGDVIRIGRHQLTYINNDASPDDNFEQTVVLRPGAFAMAAAA